MRAPLRRNSILKKLTLFLAVVLALQCIVFAAFLLMGGTLEHLDQNAMDILNERTINRKSYLESEMTQRWSNLDRVQVDMSTIINGYLAENQMAYADLNPENPKIVNLLAELSDPLISMLRTNAVTGAFIVFQGDSPLERPAAGISDHRSGLYFRDMDPNSNPDDNSDIMVERGSSDLFRTLNLPMDVNWKPTLPMGNDDDTYYMPLLAATEGRWTTPDEMGYWSRYYTLDDDNVPAISYSQPLLDSTGQPYGVLGVEIAADYFRRLMPSSELNHSQAGAYLLATRNVGDVICHTSVSNGGIAKRILDANGSFQPLETPVYADIFFLDASKKPGGGAAYASIQPLNLYNRGTPFSDQSWLLAGIVEETALFAFSVSVAKGVLWLTLAMLISGVLLALFFGNLYTRPIRTLAERVRHLDPTQPVSLPPVSIQEIDDLATSIERLSTNVSQASSRLTKIVELSDLQLAAFEVNQNSDHPYYTKNFFSVLGRPEPATPLTARDFTTLLAQLREHVEEGSYEDGITLFRLPSVGLGYRWLRMQTIRSDATVLGVITDVTTEIVEKRRLEYERDYDPMTHLLNRHSFQARLNRLERFPEQLSIAAMLMMDLDNLKYLNDTYGHDCGDDYIRCAADVLRDFQACGGLAFRISGDEFHLFLSGYTSRQALQNTIDRIQESVSEACITLPDGQSYRLRASMGVSWYPDDSTSLQELVRYADFAMYEAKNATKGGTRNFNLATYQRDSFLLYGQEEMDRILDENAVDYAFQPIVSCRDGSLFAYEALMRPRSSIISSPLDMIRIARAQSKLQQIERLTWFRALESFAAQKDVPSTCMVFVNSIASHAMTEQEGNLFINTYKEYLARTVIELTEGDEQNAEATLVKQDYCRKYGIRLALDDFGTGYSNDSVLLYLQPNFVKVDVAIIRGIDADRTRQTMLRNLVNLCHDLNVRVIAEGVETEPELLMVVSLGADFIQGYYTGKPSIVPKPVSPEVQDTLRRASQALEHT